MASPNRDPNDPFHPPSIPLQDLSRPPGLTDDAQGGRRPTRSSTGSGRNLMRDGGRRYERVAEDSPSPTDRRRSRQVPQIVTPPRSSAPRPVSEYSPVEDLGGFQEALGFAGLSFQGEGTPQPLPPTSAPRLGMVTEYGDHMEDDIPRSSAGRRFSEESQRNVTPPDSDFTPLNDVRHQQPMDGVGNLAPHGRRRANSSFQGVHFHSNSSPGGMLGDDLPSAEAGLGRARSNTLGTPGSSQDRQRSLSPSSAGSPLYRAGSMMRKMSQRVVNLSNEPEIVAQTLRRSHSESNLTEPPSFPAFEGYAHDSRTRAAPAGKESQAWMLSRKLKQEVREATNPLKGKTLGLFPANNPVRMKLCDILVHPATEPAILILIVIQTILLAIDSAPDVLKDPRNMRWGSSWIDFALLVLFVVYTIELVARIIVSGLYNNPDEYATGDPTEGFWSAAKHRTQNLFALHRQPPKNKALGTWESEQPSILRTFTTVQSELDQPGHTRQAQRIRLARRAFLRHSFNRLDFVAVVSFWISFVLGVLGIESEKHIYVFRMLSCLRILRLLGLTSGTSVILRSLKKAAPLLVNVAFLIGFFWLLFAIVGVQSFKASLRRSCVWVDPDNQQPNFTNPLQFCGGHFDRGSGDPVPWIYPDGIAGAGSHKGYVCPTDSFCVQDENPYNGTVNFDNVLQSLQLVFVIMSSNTFSELLYYTTDSDYLAAALFFAAGFVIMSLWLANLLVAVITSSFQVIREESKASAFTADVSTMPKLDDEEDEAVLKRSSGLKRLYNKTKWVWILIIIFGLVVQCLRSAGMGNQRKNFINGSETGVTLALLLEILIRFAADWRNFHKSKRNWVDLGLAVMTSVIQIPPIRSSGRPYDWLTLFQILRIYRVVLAVSVTRELIMIVLGNVSGILNLLVFVVLVTFLTAIFAVQIFRGEIPPEDPNGETIRVTFFSIYNSFLGMYQVLSSENWTSIMYNITSYQVQYSTAWIGAAFFVLWFILANFIVLNMFIAVIQENFDVSEDEKRVHQMRAFLQRKDLGGSSHGLGRAQRARDPLDYGPATTEMLLQEAVVNDFLEDHLEQLNKPVEVPERRSTSANVERGVLSSLWHKFLSLYKNREPNPFYSRLQFSRAYDELDPRTLAKEVVSATEQRKKAQREYLINHPRYNNSLYVFAPSNPVRRFCQYIVGPGRGNHRIEGVEPNKAVWFTFSAFIYAAIVAMVLLACITTPLYQKEYFQTRPFSVRNWFVFTDVGFAALFTAEAIIKVIADGFFWTPNAFFRGSWGLIDGIVLVTLWINVATSLYNEGAVSRAVGSFKALRALRLLNVSDSARDTFHSVIILGGWKIISAAFVSLSLLVPFAIYGLNLFNDQMKVCNDGGPQISNLAGDCTGEYNNTLYNWDVLSPRVASNPYYNFDDFGNSLFILFQIVSQEGWTDVMWSAQSVTGRGLQPRPFASQGNAVFFVVFNILGAVFVLTLFVSVFMRNYTEQTGVAFLTAEQRSWLEMRKLLRQISPSKRPSNKPNQKWRDWCYRQAVKKHGKWQRFVTLVLFVHLVLLVMEFYPVIAWWDRLRDFIFLAFTVFYIINIIVRIIGLTWTRFRRSSWDLYSIFAVGGTFITTMLRLSNLEQTTYEQVHKLFLVSIALLLIPRNNQLDQLFKTAAASLTAIVNLLATWFVLFLVYAIALTQTFGLTRFGPNGSGNLNFRNVPKALILLFRTSCGESWNEIMEDFATISEPNCIQHDDFLNSDCGSANWARALFISWNILSMYLFVSLFVSLIFESFSYVYQRSSGLSIVSREEIRRFKQAWATYDPDGTGFVPKEAFPRLLGELSGIFEMRIYSGDHTVGSILEECRHQEPTLANRTSDNTGNAPGTMEGVDLEKLRRRIARIPVKDIQAKRHRLNTFYEEIMVSADPDRGISFTSVLMILAHYNVINDNKSLRLEEFLRRKARLRRVEEQVRRNIVIGFFDTMYWSRFFHRVTHGRHAARMQTVPTFAVPEIYIDNEDAPIASQRQTDDASSPMSPSPGGGSSPWRSQQTTGHSPSPSSPGRLRHPTESRPGSPSNSVTGRDWSRSPSPSPSPNRQPFTEGFDWEPEGGTSPGGAAVEHSRHNSTVSAQDVLEVLDNSAWGESMRRSFTLRRPGR
ncbi:MAG: calcium channel protein [Piccolia ochrophora]|nr:MAG: calcium channel protein [Piccolia ochrophora]